MIERAKRNALALSAGHSFVIFLGPGYFPVNALNVIKMVPELCRVFCATGESRRSRERQDRSRTWHSRYH
jgi:adenosine/AMP kinase